MSKELEKINDKLGKSSNGKLDIANGLAAGLAAGLSSIQLPRMFNQLVVFLLDGSGSMTSKGVSGFSKGNEVHQAVVKVMERLVESKNSSSFDVAFWAFSNEDIEMSPIKRVTDFDLTKDCFNPCEFITDKKYTKLHSALEKVEIQVNQYLNKYEGQNRKALIIILCDGEIHDSSETLGLKTKMDKNDLITFSSILFESPDWEEKFGLDFMDKLKRTYSKLASTQADYMSSVDPEKIRSHMINSVTKVSKY
jgi:uncharacterized protein YegL